MKHETLVCHKRSNTCTVKDTSPNLEVLPLHFKKKTFLENKKYISLRVQRWEDFHLYSFVLSFHLRIILTERLIGKWEK